MKKVAVILMFLLVTGIAGITYSQSSSSTGSIPTDQDTASDGTWKKDFDKKLDTTIQILNVVKDEMKEDEEIPEKAVSDAGDEDASLKESVRAIIRKTGRIWKKVQEIAREDEDLIDEESDVAREKEQNEALSKKIDTTIEIMQVMKEELDKINSDDPGERSDDPKDESSDQ